MVVRVAPALAPRVQAFVEPDPQEKQSHAEVGDDYVLEKNPSFDKQYWSAIAAHAGRAPAVATRAETLREHDAAWASRMDIVHNAKDTLLCASYFVQPDAHGFEFVEGLIQAAKRGVKVGVVFDSMAMPYCNRFATEEEIEKLQSLLRKLQQYGGFVSYYGGTKEQMQLPGSGMHFKALVADGKVAMTGGRNIGGHYYGEMFNDFEMRLEGPVAKSLADDCLRMLQHGDPGRHVKGRNTKKIVDEAYAQFQADVKTRLGKPAAIDAAPVGLYHVITWDVLHQRDDRKDPNRCALALAETIKRAKREVTLTSNYATGNKLLRAAVIDAAKRGVKVRIISTGETASHISKAAFHMSQPAFAELSKHGIEVYETRNTPDHAKLYVIDDVAAFGTYNFADYGDARLVDGLVFTGEPKDVRTIKSVLERSIAACARVDPNAEKERPLKARATGVFAKLAWLFRR